MATKNIAITYEQFANGLGNHSRLTRDTSLVWHKEYVASDAEIRRDYMTRWMLQHLQGGLKITQQVAERILSKSKTQRTKDQQDAYSRAYSDFRYHIMRPKKKGSATGSTTVSTQVDVVEQALALVESMTKAQQAKFRTRVTYKK